MRKIIVLLILTFAVAWAQYAQAALVFNADFAQDGLYETSWPMEAGDVVTVDIYVSNVPAPGLISMGFKLTYDPAKLSVESAVVDQTKWPGGFVDASSSGEIDMAGYLTLEPDEDEGHIGNNIRLGTVTFRCLSEGTSAFMLLDRDGDWFVLFSEDPNPAKWIVLDGDIGQAVLLATFTEFFDLTVAKSGTGKGRVTSSPSGINCGGVCTNSYGSGTTVNLTAVPDNESKFVSWTGCDTVSQNTCTVEMTGNRAVSAVFEDDFPWVIFYPAFTKKRNR
jgi:hypothetical protein